MRYYLLAEVVDPNGRWNRIAVGDVEALHLNRRLREFARSLNVRIVCIHKLETIK